MKVNIKYRYQEFLSHVEFPALIYYYETNRLVGMNQYAIEIIGDNIRSIKELTLNQIKPKLSKGLLNNGSERIRQYPIYTRQGEKALDFEINSYKVDDRHVCIVLFEYSYKNIFDGNQEFLLPRLFWKDKSFFYMGMNESFKEDIQLPDTIQDIYKERMHNKDIFQVVDREKIYEEDLMVLKSKQPIYDKIGMLMVKNNDDLFIKYSIIPVFNKYGTAIGILGFYNHIVGKETRRQEFHASMENIYNSNVKQKNMMQVMSEILHISCSEDESHRILDRVSELLRKNFNIEKYYILGCPDDIKIVHQIYQSNEESVNPYRNITRTECKLLYSKVKKHKNIEDGHLIGPEIIYPINIIEYEVGIIVFEHKGKLIWSKELDNIYKYISKIIENMLVKERLYEYYNKEIWKNNKE